MYHDFMGRRTTLLVTGEIYHLFNRSIARQPILTRSRDLQRFLEVIDFYRFSRPPQRYSHYNRLPMEQKGQLLDALYKSGEHLIDILAFAVMPNHFHLLAKQLRENGIKLFMSQIQNSYAKYYNQKYGRSGALFQEMFKAVRIETDEQLLHTVRYIHLNPITSYVIKDPGELEKYPWTSFIDYLGKRQLALLSTDMVISHFPNPNILKEFTLNQVDYQRTLGSIKHLLME